MTQLTTLLFFHKQIGITLGQKWIYRTGALILAILPCMAFGQDYDESFIQYSRDIEKVTVIETESQLSWVRENDTLRWNKENLVIDELPRIGGCENIKGTVPEKNRCADEKMLRFIYSNLIYPVEALEDRVEGSVIISFYVNPDGKISNARVQREFGAYTAGAALDVIEKMNAENDWVPGKSNGAAVPTLYSIPIRFRLGSKNPIKHPKMYSKYYHTNNDWELVFDTEGAPPLNEEAEVRMLISDMGKVLNVKIFDPLSPAAKERTNEIVLDLLNHSKWRPGSTYSFENTMEYVFILKL